jgi:hypothetical protein
MLVFSEWVIAQGVYIPTRAETAPVSLVLNLLQRMQAHLFAQLNHVLRHCLQACSNKDVHEYRLQSSYNLFYHLYF